MCEDFETRIGRGYPPGGMALGRIALAIGCCGAAVVFVATGSGARSVHAVEPNVIAGVTPLVVSDGSAVQTGEMSDSATLKLNVGLAVRDSAGLDALIAAASDPSSRSTGTT